MSLSQLLVYKLRIFLANFSRGEKRRRYVRIASLIVILAVFAAFSLGAYAIFSALHSYGDQGFIVGGLIVVMGLHALLLVGLIFDIAATTNIFFLSSDLSLLMATPLAAIKVFALKYIESLASGSVVTILVGIPMLIGYGAAFGAPAPFYLALIPVILLFLSIPVSIGTLSGLVICRYVAASKVKEVLGVLGGLLALGLWLAIQLLRPRLEQQEYFADFDVRIRALASYGDNILPKLLPSHLAAQSLTPIATGAMTGAITPFVHLTAMAGLMIVVSIVLAQRMYLAGWTRVVPGGGKTKSVRRRLSLRRFFAWLPHVERSILTTTAHLFVRDPQQVMPIATLTIMMAVLPFLLGRSRTGFILSTRLIVQSLMALTFIGSLNLATSASAIDGRNFWVILLGPCSAVRKLIAKLLTSVIFFVLLACAIALALGVTRIVTWGFALKLIWAAACAACVGGSAGILLGMSYADWEWEIPKRMLRTTGRLIMLAVMACFFVGIAILASASSLARGLVTSRTADLIILIIGSIVAGAVTAILLRLSARRLEKMEWTL